MYELVLIQLVFSFPNYNRSKSFVYQLFRYFSLIGGVHKFFDLDQINSENIISKIRWMDLLLEIHKCRDKLGELNILNKTNFAKFILLSVVIITLFLISCSNKEDGSTPASS